VHVDAGFSRACARTRSWAGLIPNTALPILLGSTMRWFPSHLVAFRCFFLIGGSISALAWLVMLLMVHPSSERPGRLAQCTRHWVWDRTDEPVMSTFAAALVWRTTCMISGCLC
jgi:hypothetical protein